MNTLKALYARLQDDDAAGVSAELAFRLLFALFPFLIFLAALGSYVARWTGIEDPSQEVLNAVGDTLPSDAASILESQLRGIFESQRAGLLSLTALLALWSASSGTKTVMKALNRAYDVEDDRPFLRRQAVGVALTVVGGVAFLAAAVVLVVGQAVGEDVASSLGLGEAWSVAANWLRLPVVLLLIVVAVAFVYWSAPNADKPWRWASWGAALFVVAWLVVTVGFGFYVSNFASYQNTYGSLGGVIVLMTWTYLSAFLLILGAELDAVLQRAHSAAPSTVQSPARAPEATPEPPRAAERAIEAPRGSSRTVAPQRRIEVRVDGVRPATVALREHDGERPGPLSTGLGAVVAGVVLMRLQRRGGRHEERRDGRRGEHGNQVVRVEGAE